MTNRQFILELPKGTEFSIEDFVSMVNKKLKSQYTVRSKEPEQRDLLPAIIQQLNKRLTIIEDYLNDWCEAQANINKSNTGHFALLENKVTELDQWANTVIEETNHIISQVNAYDPEGSRKYMFSVIDSIVKEINEQRQVVNKILEDMEFQLAERAVKNIEKLEEKLKKNSKKEQKLKGNKELAKKPVKKPGKSVKKNSKKDIDSAKEELEKSVEPTDQPPKRGRGRPKKETDQQVPVETEKKKRGRPKKTETQ